MDGGSDEVSTTIIATKIGNITNIKRVFEVIFRNPYEKYDNLLFIGRPISYLVFVLIYSNGYKKQ